jgi:hypothetical protein
MKRALASLAARMSGHSAGSKLDASKNGVFYAA